MAAPTTQDILNQLKTLETLLRSILNILQNPTEMLAPPAGRPLRPGKKS